MVYHEADGVVVSWDGPVGCAVLEFRAYSEGEVFRTAMNAVIALLKEKKARKLLSDSRAMKALTQSDQRWIDEEWRFQARAAGLAYNAIVLPKSAIAKMSIKAIVSKIEAGRLEFMHFADVDEARAWLKSR